MLIMFCGWGCLTITENNSLPPEDDGIILEAYNIEYTYSDSAVVKARLTSGHMVEKNEGKEKAKKVVRYLNEGVFVEFFNGQKQRVSTLKANRAELEDNNNVAELRGKVEVENINSERLETEKLYWNEKQDKIFTDEPVRIRLPDKIIKGVGLEANTSFTAYTLFRVTGTLQLEE